MTHREVIDLAGAPDGGIGLPLVPYLAAAHTLAPTSASPDSSPLAVTDCRCIEGKGEF